MEVESIILKVECGEMLPVDAAVWAEERLALFGSSLSEHDNQTLLRLFDLLEATRSGQ